MVPGDAHCQPSTPLAQRPVENRRGPTASQAVVLQPRTKILATLAPLHPTILWRDLSGTGWSWPVCLRLCRCFCFSARPVFKPRHPERSEGPLFGFWGAQHLESYEALNVAPRFFSSAATIRAENPFNCASVNVACEL